MSKPAIKAKAISQQEILDVLASQYGIVGSEIHLFEGGTESGVWKIRDGKSQYVFKVYAPKEISQDQIEQEINLYSYVNERSAGLPIQVPVVQAAHNQERVVQFNREGTTYFGVLMQFEELRRLWANSIRNEDITLIGSAIAHLHRILEGYPDASFFEYKPTLSTQSFSFFSQSPNSSAFSSVQRTNFKNIDARATRYLTDVTVPTDLAQTLIHADLTLEHIQLLQNGDVYIFDWGDAVVGPALKDVAIFFVELFREGEISVERWKEMENVFLESYTNVKPIQSTHIDALKWFSLERCLGAIQYISEISIKSGNEADVEGITRRYKLMEVLCTTGYTKA